MSSFYACRIFFLSGLTVLLVLFVHLHTALRRSPSGTGVQSRHLSHCLEIQSGTSQAGCFTGSISRPVLYTYIYCPFEPAAVTAGWGISESRLVRNENAENQDKVQPLKHNHPYKATGQSEFASAINPIISDVNGLGIAPPPGTAGVTGSAEADYNQMTKTLTILRPERDVMIFCFLMNSGTSPVQSERT